MDRWTVPLGRKIPLPRGVDLVGQNKDDGSYLYTHEAKRKYYKVTQTALGWTVEEWGHDELDLEDCDC